MGGLDGRPVAGYGAPRRAEIALNARSVGFVPLRNG